MTNGVKPNPPDGCPTFASAYVGRKRWGETLRTLFARRARYCSRESSPSSGRSIRRTSFSRRGAPLRMTFLWEFGRKLALMGSAPPKAMKRFLSSHRSPWKHRAPLCHPERSRGICSSADHSWKCFSTDLRRPLRLNLRTTQGAQIQVGDIAYYLRICIAGLVGELLPRWIRAKDRPLLPQVCHILKGQHISQARHARSH
jgi:hypothetical protein